mgnify:CR=1 FL=1
MKKKQRKVRLIRAAIDVNFFGDIIAFFLRHLQESNPSFLQSEDSRA